ncbi:MAG: hypothetical protein QGF28_01430 [Candidatus Thalassarchaeaceae archaeon]|jgi:hypothetical protein|nr:hypothetical protein [Candidatus Thalassarchaeaceae archaeon]|tara:strand:+ start:618 stop:1181 length:564 start_codon:yes stop_codon:yes gene_type:complete
MMGLLEKVASRNSEDKDSEVAHVILERLGEGATAVITPTRVVFASITAFLILSASLFVLVWVIPYDNVDVDIVYMQAGSGHVVLAELDNKGSRTLEEVTLTMRFLDSDGIEKGRSDFAIGELPAHTSIAGDDLEMIVAGQSVWEQYTIEVILNYQYYGGGDASERWTHEVGDWTREVFVDEVPFSLF